MKAWTAKQTRQLPVFAAALPMVRFAAAQLHNMPITRTAGRWRG